MKGIIKHKTWRGLSSSPSLTGKEVAEDIANRAKIENRGKRRQNKQDF